MLTVNQENFNQWLVAMRDPANKQARSALCVVNPDGSKAYCCLGLGSKLVPDMEIRENEHSETMSFNGMTNLAPYRFVEWLGIDVAAEINNEDTEAGLRAREYDLMPDWPEGLHTQGSPDQVRNGFGSYAIDLSAAGMNDDGFTFEQIADVFQCFGIGRVIS